MSNLVKNTNKRESKKVKIEDNGRCPTFSEKLIWVLVVKLVLVVIGATF